MKVQVGKTQVISLIDSKADFLESEALVTLNKALESIQIEMFEFQNFQVDGGKWPPKGWPKWLMGGDITKSIVKRLIEKKLENPDIKIQT